MDTYRIWLPKKKIPCRGRIEREREREREREVRVSHPLLRSCFILACLQFPCNHLSLESLLVQAKVIRDLVNTLSFLSHLTNPDYYGYNTYMRKRHVTVAITGSTFIFPYSCQINKKECLHSSFSKFFWDYWLKESDHGIRIVPWVYIVHVDFQGMDKYALNAHASYCISITHKKNLLKLECNIPFYLFDMSMEIYVLL